MGKGDRKTKKGKISMGTYGKTRKHTKKNLVVIEPPKAEAKPAAKKSTAAKKASPKKTAAKPKTGAADNATQKKEASE